MAERSQLTAWVTPVCGGDCSPGVLALRLVVRLSALAACYSLSVLNHMWAVAAVLRGTQLWRGRFLTHISIILCTDKNAG